MSSSNSHPNESSSQFRGLFNAALNKYNQKTGKDIATHPLTTRLQNCDSSDSVLGILKEQARAFKDWRIHLMRCLRPTVDILLRLSTSGAFEGIGLGLPPAKAIFAGVGFLLAAADGVSTSYDALMELFEYFEYYLGRLKVLSVIPSALGEILVKIMVELLEVLALATEQISQGRFKKFAKKLIGEKDIEAVLQRLDRLTAAELRMTATQTMEAVYGLFNNMKVVIDYGEASMDNTKDALGKLQKITDDLLRERIQEWLSPPDSSINYNVACEAHHDGTAEWFLKGLIYNEWKATGSLLWTHGNPGSGKSVLCSSIIKDIKSCATGLASVAYYYFDFKDTGKQDRRGFLSSLLTQLCSRSHHGYDIVSSLYLAHGNGSRQPSEVDLIRCLKEVLASPDRGRVYIIVDAVDESPNRPGIPSPREKVLRLIRELVGLRHPDIRICITSRPEVDIRTVLEPLASHAVSLHDEGGQKSDILNYVKSVVESDENMRKWRREDRQLVVDSLSRKATGMFRWVVCQLDTLRHCFPASIRRALNELPMTLDETYERILLGIDREKREYAIRLFQCLAFSRRPLLAKELAEIFAIQFDAAIPDLNTSLRPGDADEAVLSACSTLVTIVRPDDNDDDNGDDDDDDDDDDNNSRVVQFSHYSVKEYLTSERLAKSCKGDISEYHISPKLAHTALAQTCISTLLQLDLHVKDIADSFPLAVYATENWFHHAQCDGVAPQIQDGLERLFDPNRTHFATWVSIHDIDGNGYRSRARPSPLYYAALCGIESLVVHLIACGHDPNQCRGNKGTCLRAAVVSGHTATARILLEHAADANAQDMNGITLLHEAATCGNLKITQLLLSHGAEVNTSDNFGDSPLHKAIRSQKHDVVELLLKGGADIDARTRYGETPLHEAARRGDFRIVKSLLSHGADVEAFDGTRNSPLHKAVLSQKLDVVKLLLEGGADVNTWDEYDSTPLHEAARGGRFDIVQSLLDRDADIRALDYKGDSPLHMAVRSPEFGVIKLLLENRADLNVRNVYNLTPLDEAERSRNPEILQLLRGPDAVADTPNDEENSPKPEAVPSRNLEAVKHLLKAGASAVVNIWNNYKPLWDAVVDRIGDTTDTICEARDWPWHKAARSPKLCVTKLTAMGFVDMDHSPYFISLLKMLSELASWCMPGACTFGNLGYWSHKFVKRFLVLLALQWWSVPLRASIRGVVSESFKGFFPRFFRKESMEHFNSLKFSVFIATVGVTSLTYAVTYQVTLPLAVTSTLTRILLEILLIAHAWMSLMMDLHRAVWEDA